MRSGIAIGVRVGLIAGVLSASVTSFAQAATPAQAAQGTPAADAKQFDVATVKPSAPLDMQKMAADIAAGKMPNIGMHITGLRAEYNYLTLKELVSVAYKVKAYQVTGPAWIATEHFDIVAKMPDGSKREDAPAMLQALLVERLKLKVHRETQEHPVLALIVGKSGPKMKESPGDAPPLDLDAPLQPGEMQMDTADGPARMTIDRKGGGATMNMGTKGTIKYGMDSQTMLMHMTSSKTTMAALADMLTQMMTHMGGGGQQVVDMTGLKGNYEVALEFSLADMMATARAQGLEIPGGQGAAAATTSKEGVAQASDPGGGSTVFRSVEALGLKLDQRKAPVEQIVVDSVEKTPTEN